MSPTLIRQTINADATAQPQSYNFSYSPLGDRSYGHPPGGRVDPTRQNMNLSPTVTGTTIQLPGTHAEVRRTGYKQSGGTGGAWSLTCRCPLSTVGDEFRQTGAII